MNKLGFSLVELLIVIALISILSAVGTFQFSQYSRKSEIEGQTRKLYGDLMELRGKAMFEKTSRGVRMTSTSYSIYSSAAMAGIPLETKTLKAPIQRNSTEDIMFDTRGITTNKMTVCTTESNSASVDSIVVSSTRIQLGKLKEGTNCDDANVIAQ